MGLSSLVVEIATEVCICCSGSSTPQWIFEYVKTASMPKVRWVRNVVKKSCQIESSMMTAIESTKSSAYRSSLVIYFQEPPISACDGISAWFYSWLFSGWCCCRRIWPAQDSCPVVLTEKLHLNSSHRFVHCSSHANSMFIYRFIKSE